MSGGGRIGKELTEVVVVVVVVVVEVGWGSGAERDGGVLASGPAERPTVAFRCTVLPPNPSSRALGGGERPREGDSALAALMNAWRQGSLDWNRDSNESATSRSLA